MSAYTEQQTQFKDTALLIEALKECGIGEVLTFDTAQQLEGYHGDKREDTAEIIIPRRVVGAASNDIGFKKQSDGTYRAIISEYDSSYYNQKWMNKLTDKYTELGIMSKAKKIGLRVIGKKVVNGKLQLQFLKA